MNGNFFQSILTPTTQPNIHCITSTDFTRGGSLEDHLPTNNGFKRIRQEEEDEQGGEGEGIENYLPEQQHHTQQRQHINSFPLGYKTYVFIFYCFIVFLFFFF